MALIPASTILLARRAGKKVARGEVLNPEEFAALERGSPPKPRLCVFGQPLGPPDIELGDALEGIRVPFPSIRRR